MDCRRSVMTMRPILTVLLAACDSSEPAPQTCAEMAGLPKDQCDHQKSATTRRPEDQKSASLPGALIEDVLAKAGLIQDSIVRQAVVYAWVENHNNEIPRDRGQSLCQMLDGRHQPLCLRRLSSPHLYEDRSPVMQNNPNNQPPPEN